MIPGNRGWHLFGHASGNLDWGRYLQALCRGFRTWLVETDVPLTSFFAREVVAGRLEGPAIALQNLAAQLSGRSARVGTVSSSVRSADRHANSFWGHLNTMYGSQLGTRVILPRLFLNFALQPWFRALWNLDRILVDGDNVWMLEIKHKFPFGGRQLKFGLNDGEMQLIATLGEAGVRCLLTILVKPLWDNNAGSGYLLANLAHRERAALICSELDAQSLRRKLQGQGSRSGAHTTFSGSGSLPYRSMDIEEFGWLGRLAEPHAELARRLSGALSGDSLSKVTNEQLQRLRVDTEPLR